MAPFRLEEYLAALNITDFEESLPDASRKLLLVHSKLVQKSDEAVELASQIYTDSSAVVWLVGQIDSEEPRVPLMVLTALLTDSSGALGPEKLEMLRHRVAMRLPKVFEHLTVQANGGDVCPDAHTYAVTLTNHLLQRTSGETLQTLSSAAANLTWIRVLMRHWRDASLSQHVSWIGSDEDCDDLGSLVSLYLEVLLKATEASGSGVRALEDIGAWGTAFFTMRLYGKNVEPGERARICGILYAILSRGSSQTEKAMLHDTDTLLRAVLNSAATLIDSAGAEVPRPKIAVVSGSDDAEHPETNKARKMSALGLALYEHIRLLKYAVRRGGPMETKRVRNFFRVAARHSWFWDNLGKCADVTQYMVGYEVMLSTICASAYIRMPCLRAALSHIVWSAAVWLARDNVRWTASPNTLSRKEVWTRICNVSHELWRHTLKPLGATASRVLAGYGEMGLFKDRPDLDSSLLEDPAESADSYGFRVCEWCLKMTDRTTVALRRCSRCEASYFCNAEHLKLSWRQNHKLWCTGDIVAVLAEKGLETQEDGYLWDTRRGHNLGTTFGNHGLDYFVRTYGGLAALVGAGLRIDEVKPSVFEAKFMPRGELARTILHRVEQTPSARLIFRALMTTCCQLYTEVSFVCVFYADSTAPPPADGSPPRVFKKIRVGIYRPGHCSFTLVDRVDPADQGCRILGCTDHDIMVSVLLSKLR